MRKAFYFITLFLFIIRTINAQETIILNVDKSGYLTSDNIEDLGGTGGGNEVIPTIKGELNVNPVGALTYTIPIEVIKGVNEFQPNLVLGYNSDGGNGQAGYGWNIVGISTITIGGKSKEIDGITQGSQFDENDPYYLDGQRLIGFNEDSPNNAVTEVYSTIKVSKIQEGDYLFKVQYPDGKIAKYKYVAPGQYSIGLFVDNYNNEIKYNYTTEENTPYIESIIYGKLNGTNPFSIEFEWENRNQPIHSYRNGIKSKNTNVLKTISINSIQAGLFRKYLITHDINSLGNERLRIVDVENNLGDRLKSLSFNYDDAGNISLETKELTKVKANSNVEGWQSLTFGDFYGNGKIISVYLQDEKYDKNKLLTSEGRLLETFNDPDYDLNLELYPIKSLNDSGKLTENHQLIEVWNGDYEEVNTPNGTIAEETITIKIRDLITNTITKEFTADFTRGFHQNFDDVVMAEIDFTPRNNFFSDFNNDGITDWLIVEPGQNSKYYYEEFSPGKIYFQEIGKQESGDLTFIELNNEDNFYFNSFQRCNYYLVEFDGDGIPEILVYNTGFSEKLIIENHRVSDAFIVILKLDLISNSFKVIYENTLVNSQNQAELASHDFTATDWTKDIPFIIGDYNGDGLTDFLTPLKVYDVEDDGVIYNIEYDNKYWLQYVGTGTGYNSKVRDFTDVGLAYLKPGYEDNITRTSLWQKMWGNADRYNYTFYGSSSIFTLDFNSDGKTDIAQFKKFGRFEAEENLSDIEFNNVDPCFDENGNCEDFIDFPFNPDYTPQNSNHLLINLNLGSDESEDFNFGHIYPSEIDGWDDIFDVNVNSIKYDLSLTPISPFSYFINSQNNNYIDSYNSRLILHDPLLGKILDFSIKTEEFLENRIISINNGSGVIQEIEYTSLQKDLPCNCWTEIKENCSYIYNPDALDLAYPYYIHKQVPMKFMVSKINTFFDDKSITKEYRYENAVQYLDGKGFLGFQKTYISDPYESIEKNGTYLPKRLQTPVFWNINTYDPEINNQLVESKYGELNGDYFTRSQLSYTHYTPTNYPNSNISEKQYLYQTYQEINHDRIKNITITKTHTYDEQADFLLLNTVTNHNGEGTTTSIFQYQSPWSVGDHYYNGKIYSIQNTVNAYGETFTTRDDYSLFNDAGIARRSKKYGNNTTAITTTVNYDVYGNKTKEKVQAPGVTPLETVYAYDATKRHVRSVTNPEGLTATQVVDVYGKITEETSALGITTQHTYDGWGNPLTSTEYFGTSIAQTTTLVKENLGNGFYTLSTTTPGEPRTIVTFDKFDREVSVKTQSINNQWIAVNTEYDIFGKKIKVSQPYFDTESPTLWNTTEYDELDRPIKQTLYNGKIITTCINGMTVTVDDGDQKTSKTVDVFGNVVNHKDFGGEIIYNYYPNGTLKSANYGGVIIEVEQDGWGNKTRLSDPSAGVYEYTYDNLSRKLTEVTPKGTTNYTYDDFGKLLYEITLGTNGDNTNLSLQYEYDSESKLPKKIIGFNGTESFEYETFYDDFYRIEGKKETTPFFVYETATTFDNIGRPNIISTQTTITANGQIVETAVRNHYDANGLQTKLINENTSQILWQIDEINAKGQLLQMQLGNGYEITQGYDSYYLPQSIQHSKTGNTALHISYQFDAEKQILLSRNNQVFNKNESFEYDDLYRLTKEILNGSTLNAYAYDKRGRITYNSQIGHYEYNDTDYKIQQIGFNATGQQIADERGFHNIAYNSFKQAVSIHLPDKERIDFSYNPFRERIAMYYGSEDEDKTLRPLRKYYSSDKAIEIKHNIQSGEIEVFTYLDGDPYSANVLQHNLFDANNTETRELWYLHRDYQATILAITNQDGDILEQRYFDAWGSLKEYMGSNGDLVVVTHATQINLILDRGYTGHEHLWGVDLVHMNGRLYDAKLRRFLSPDNFVQDPYNTQNFNRYAYVLNNPLIYTDPSGEELISATTAIIIGAVVGMLTNTIMNITNGMPWYFGILKAGSIGAVSGFISFGIGSAATSISNSLAQAAFQAGAHGITGGYMNLLDGGQFGSGFYSAVVSSLISSGISIYADIRSMFDFIGSSGMSQNTLMALQIASGGISGGISSSIAGGNFWQGVRQGLITSGLNHVAHAVFPPRKGKYNMEYYSDDDGNFFWNDELDSWEWYKRNSDGGETYGGQYRISLVEQGWDYAADKFLSPIVEGGQVIGYIFKAGFYDLPKQAIELGRADNIKIDADLTVWEIRDGIFQKKTLNSSMSFDNKINQLVYPSVKSILTPVSFGTKIFSNSLLNFGVNGILKSQTINQIKTIEQR